MRRVLRIIVATFSLYLVTHLFVFTALPIAILLSYVDEARTPALKRWFVRCLFSIVGQRLKVSGQANVDPARGYVIVSNYPSGYAGFALIGEFPQASLVASAFLRKIPILGQALRRIGAVFVQPGAAGHGRKALDIYLGRSGVAPSMIILPEGGRTRDGKIHRFRRGFIHIQRQTASDVLPVTLNGFFQLKPLGRFHLDPDAKPEMVIHPAVSALTANRMSDDELITLVRDTIASAYRP